MREQVHNIIVQKLILMTEYQKISAICEKFEVDNNNSIFWALYTYEKLKDGSVSLRVELDKYKKSIHDFYRMIEFINKVKPLAENNILGDTSVMFDSEEEENFIISNQILEFDTHSACEELSSIIKLKEFKE